MNNVEKALNRELKEIKLRETPEIISAITSLCYSADETGMLPCKVDAEMALMIWKLVEIALRCDGEISDDLKM
jgi:hypothetical protein